MFAREDGTDLHPAWITDRFTDLTAEADLPPIRLHDTRHVAASTALEGGATMRDVQVMLGHGSLGTTERYTSAYPQGASRTAAASEAAIHRSS